MRVRLLLAYEGTAYKGWQIQATGLPTIQSAVETALFAIYGEHIRVTGSGRTDSGVHALGQVAHFDVKKLPRDLRHSLNALLPSDIRVLKFQQTRPNFHARNDATSKTYIYNFWQETAFVPPQLRSFIWSCGPLRLDAMLEAARLFQGWHDFASFQNTGTEILSTIREIYALELEPLPPLPYFPTHLPALRMTVSANGFLKQMVRNIAGSLYDIGKGKMNLQDLNAIMGKRDRRTLISPTAPACGLSLARVEYAKEVWPEI